MCRLLTRPSVRPTVKVTGPRHCCKTPGSHFGAAAAKLPRQCLQHRTSVLAQLNCDFPALSLAVVAVDSPSREEANQA